MKTIPLFIFCFGLVLSFAQTEPEHYENSTGIYENTTVTDENSDYNQNDSGQQYNDSGNANSWDRTDYYESRKEPERVQYYSGGYRGSNIINPADNYYEESPSDDRKSQQFPDIIRYYSGGYYGNNIINKDAVERVKDAYYE
jgi:hypothetical protein